MQTIQDLFMQQKLKYHYQYIMLNGLSREIELFPTNTTYDLDLLLPSHLKDVNFR